MGSSEIISTALGGRTDLKHSTPKNSKGSDSDHVRREKRPLIGYGRHFGVGDSSLARMGTVGQGRHPKHREDGEPVAAQWKIGGQGGIERAI